MGIKSGIWILGLEKASRDFESFRIVVRPLSENSGDSPAGPLTTKRNPYGPEPFIALGI
jgi:hypothetical protein